MPIPVTVYKQVEDGKVLVQKNVYPVDLEAWYNDGWTRTNPDKTKPTLISLNSASEAELTTLGLSASKAKTVVRNRPFASVAEAIEIVKELDKVSDKLQL